MQARCIPGRTPRLGWPLMARPVTVGMLFARSLGKRFLHVTFAPKISRVGPKNRRTLFLSKPPAWIGSSKGLTRSEERRVVNERSGANGTVSLAEKVR